MNAPHPPVAVGERIVGAGVEHESARLHVAGEATYTDDLLEPAGTLHAAVGKSPLPHGRIRSVDLAAVSSAPGVVAVVTAADIPGVNDVGPIQHDDPILADGVVLFAGQPVFAVAATSANAARAAAKLARFDLEPLPAVLTIDEALAAESYVLPPAHLVRGDPAAAIGRAPHRLRGTAASGGQDHFYLEGQVALAVPTEQRGMRVWCSTQHPGEVQQTVAHALGVAAHDVVVECRRMGGGFGGKETQMSQFACLAAILARRTGAAVKFRVDRDDDMILTGKRHAFRYGWDVGFDADGRILGLDLTLASRCGFSADLSGPINDRAMFHADNAYWLPDVAIHSYRCRTHTVSDTAFRGFGGPQGMFAIEMVMDRIARALGRDPLDVRRANLYGTVDRNVAPYGMTIEDNLGPELFDRLEASSRYRERRQAIAAWNRASPVLKRGIALTPVKFGISFTATHYNQAGALLHLYSDGTLLLNHGGTEMGQGLFTKVAQVVAQELGVPLASVRVSASDTSKVPNASPTAASSGSDLNGMAARDAARALKARLAEFAATKLGGEPADVVFAGGEVRAGAATLPFSELARRAYFARVPLSATGFYATPKIHYDRKTLTGRPFFYFAWGAAVSEVVVDTLTGECRLLAVDILHDAGSSLNPAIDRGQVEGGFLQGWGWLTMEALWWNDAGELKTHSPSTYKIPTAREWPERFAIDFLDRPNGEDTVHRSKAVGEPPFMLALSAFHAIRDAIGSVGDGRAVALDAPATAEAIVGAIADLVTPARAGTAHGGAPGGKPATPAPR
jgi:xanthine dehydrogenase large subunit